MAIVPVPRTKKITFFQVRLTPWAESAAEIGLEGEDVAAMEELVAAARAAQLAQRMARDKARTATATYKQAVKKMCGRGSDCIKKIKARAAAVGGSFNNVNELSLIPPAADSSPLPPPGQPTSFRTELRADGALKLSWSCKNPKGSQGTIYEVWRQAAGATGVAGDQPLEFAGTVGVKHFIDAKIRAGAASVIYQIIAVRSTKRGVTGTHYVKFSANARGGGAPVAMAVSVQQRAA